MAHFFYEDERKEIMRESLLTERALNWATLFLNPSKPKDMWQRNPKLTSTQIRKFHIETKDLEEKIKSLHNLDDEFAKIKPLVKMLRSKAAYSCPVKGKDRKIPIEFRKFIEDMVDNISDWKDFKAFTLCFEAVVGYFYGLGGR